MIIYLLFHIIQAEITVLHTSLSGKLTCGTTSCNLDGWTQSASPNILNCPILGVAYNILDSTNKNMYRSLSYYYPKSQLIVWFDIFYYGVWNNEAITIKYNNVIIATYYYTNPTIYPYSGELCDALSYDVQSKKISITTQNSNNLVIATSSNNGKAIIRNFIYAVEKCHWSCKTCTTTTACTSCYTSFSGGLCLPCQYYTDPTGCVVVCDLNKYPDQNKYCQDTTEPSYINDQFKNAAPMVQWIRIADSQGYTTTLKCSQYFGLLTGGEGMEKIITQGTQYKHWLRIKIYLYLYGTIPLNNGIIFTINGNYVNQLYNNAQIVMDNNGYIMKKTATTCTEVGNGYQYILMIYYPVPTGDFTIRLQSNWQQSTTVWGVTQIQINAGRCQQECLSCTYEYVCSQCKPTYYLYQGKCINTNPSDTIYLNATNVVSYDLEYPYSVYLVNDLFSYYIKNDPDSYFTLVSQNYQNFLTGLKSSGLYTKKVFGGPYVWSNAQFTKTFSISTAHYGISIRMKIILSDLFAQQFVIQFETDTPESITATSPIDLFGKTTLEYQVNKYWYLNHNANTFTITVECQGDGNLLHSYCAISDYYIVVHNCSPFCLVCTDSTTCTSYDSNYATAKFQQSDCLSNEYISTYNCYPCTSDCPTCISSTYCTSCVNNLILNDGKCLCPLGQYLDTQYCYNCDTYCQSCMQFNYCNKCIESTQRVSINGICVCETGFYEHSGLCIKCHNSCLTCSGPTINDCLNCDTSLYFTLQTVCVCQDGYYLSYGICKQCHYSCLTCFGPSSNQCLHCQPTRQLVGLRCLCQIGYFEDSTYQCPNCPIIENSFYSECYFNCNSIMQWHNIVCTYIPTCLITQYIQNYQCQSICGDLIVMPDEQCDDLTSYCYNCQYRCPLYCPNCSTTTCIDVCGDGYVTGSEQCDDAITSITCSSCLYSCQTQCSNCQDGRCYACSTNGYMLQNYKCVEHCGDNIKVGSEECEDSNSNIDDGCDNNCKFRCRSDCLECSANRKSCLTCLNSGYKPVVNSYKCVPICGDGLRISNSFDTEQCDDGNLINNDGCNSSCQWQCQPIAICTTCVSNLCTVCAAGYTLLSAKNICVPICGDGIVKTTEICDDANNQYYDGCNQKCQLMCQPQCITCTANGCTQCDSGYILNKYNNKCKSSCGDGFVTDNEQCDDLIHSNCYQCRFRCSYGCQLCVYGNCLQCIKGFQLNFYNRQCDFIIPVMNQIIPSKQYYTIQTFFYFCNVQVSNICLECDIGFYYDEFSNSCKEIIIQECPLNCLICKNSICIECFENYILLNQQCFKQANYIIQPSCSSSCKNCFNGQCYTCKQGYEIQIINQQCIPICGDRLVTDDEECDDNNLIIDDGCVDCQFTCFGNCLNCRFGKCYDCESPQLLIYDKMQCYDPEPCDKGYYVNQQNNQCESKCGDYIKTDNEECDTNILCIDCQFICSLNCKYCIDNVCYTCDDDYYLDDKYQCQPKQSVVKIVNLIKEKINNTICDGEYCFYQQQPRMKLQLSAEKNNLQQFTIQFDQQVKMCTGSEAQIYLDDKFYQIIDLTNSSHNEFLIQYNQTILNPQIQINVSDCIKNLYQQKLESYTVNLRSNSIILLTKNEEYATSTLSNIANSFQYLIVVSLPLLLIIGNFNNFLNFIDLIQYSQFQQYLNQPPNTDKFLSTFLNINSILQDISFYQPYYIDTKFSRNGSFLTTSIPIVQLYAFTALVHFSIKIVSRMFRQSTLDLRTQNKSLLKLHIQGNKFLHHLNKNNLMQKFQNVAIFSGLELCMNSAITMSLGQAVSKQEQYSSLAAMSVFFLGILYSVKMPTLITLKNYDSELNPIPKPPEQYSVNTLVFGQCLKKMLYSITLVYCQSNPTLASMTLCFVDFSYGCFIYKTQPFIKQENNKVILQQINLTLTNGCNVINSMRLFENTKVLGFFQMAVLVQSLGQSVINEIWQKRTILKNLLNLFKFQRVDSVGVVEFLVYE